MKQTTADFLVERLNGVRRICDYPETGSTRSSARWARANEGRM
jgi:hypothetical protein